MLDDKMFDYVLARSRARETSILAVASIASSASVVLLGLIFQCNCLLADNVNFLTTVGIVFAGLGMVYRELSVRLIHDNDERWLRRYVKKWRENKSCLTGIIDDCVKDPMLPNRYDWTREAVIRVLLVTPAFAWAWTFNTYVSIGVIGIVSGLIIGFSACHADKD